MDSLIPVVIVAVLVLLNGLFVAAEFAIVGVPRLAIEKRARAGERVARTVKYVIDDGRRRDRYIATAQLGITIASLGLGMYGEHTLAEWLVHRLEVTGLGAWLSVHAAASVIAVTILTYFHIVVGEMVPKSFALLHAERTSLAVTPPMMVIQTIWRPLVVALVHQSLRFKRGCQYPSWLTRRPKNRPSVRYALARTGCSGAPANRRPWRTCSEPASSSTTAG